MKYQLKCANCDVGLFTITITKEDNKIAEILVTCTTCNATADMAITAIDSIVGYNED